MSGPVDPRSPLLARSAAEGAITKNEGFLGEVVSLNKVVIEAGPSGIPIVTAEVQFAAPEGTVHAVATHQFILDPEQPDPAAAAARELMRHLTARIEALHFKAPRALDGGAQVLRGIAETLREPAADADEPGTQA